MKLCATVATGVSPLSASSSPHLSHFLLLSQVLCTLYDHACLFSLYQFKFCVTEAFPKPSLSSTFKTLFDFNVSTVLNTNRNASGYLCMGWGFPLPWEVNSVSGLHCSLIPLYVYFLEQQLLCNRCSVNACWKKEEMWLNECDPCLWSQCIT